MDFASLLKTVSNTKPDRGRAGGGGSGGGGGGGSGSGDGFVGWHGGLLDGDDRDGPGDRHDPSVASQVYWHIDLARAAHPRHYVPSASFARIGPPQVADRNTRWDSGTASSGAVGLAPSSTGIYCPLGCQGRNLSSWSAQLGPPSKAQCAEVRARWPTLLGVDPWNCYWEWVLADVGPNAYMHRPLYWATLQFAERGAGGEAPAICGQIEWPGRYLMRLVLVAQRALKARTGGYTTNTALLAQACEEVDGCDAADLRYALATPAAFPELRVEVEPNATRLRPDCAARPCFRARVRVRVVVAEPPPASSSFEYVTRIDSNSKLQTEWSEANKGAGGGAEGAAAARPCLF